MDHKELKETIKDILTTIPQARENDINLIYSVYKKLGFNAYEHSAAELFMFIRSKKLPTFESITRCNRKVKEENPDLRGSKANQERREQLKEEYRSEFKKSNLLC